MSRNYAAYQYESAFRPRALKNWEVPNLFCDRPLQRSGKTKIIANSRGHILPGIVRPQCNPWGDFVGTWSMPKYISRKMADVLNRTDSGREKLKACKARLLSEKLPEKEIPKKEPDETVDIENVDNEDTMVEERKIYCEENQNVSVPNEEIQKKIMCPIHDLYNE
ncbi:unnamed protein product [Phaedon cochleariae]|uniref:Cilia- and flagella-associated protein 126 n=1 Tax=Phaedon cochleariae TaxID=80249 RepID=A0A9N9SMZ6_PHACE|nr:unnamed protein product [Phaedon cochleariae]